MTVTKVFCAPLTGAQAAVLSAALLAGYRQAEVHRQALASQIASLDLAGFAPASAGLAPAPAKEWGPAHPAQPWTGTTCRIPDDCIDSKRYPLFMARDVMRVLIEQLQAEGATPS